jgi:L-threonylcarbamoyladenylate synthase
MAKIAAGGDRNCQEEAVRLLRQGELICYPTDTVYGLGAAARNGEAVRRVFAVKGRPPDKAMPLLIAAAGEASGLADVTPTARALMERFWPGALTIVMRKAEAYRSLALGGQSTVALRVPDHPLTQEIIRRLGEPVTGTSANLASASPPVSAVEAEAAIGDMVSLVVDGGACTRGRESTVVDITGATPRIVRQGAVGRAEIEDLLALQLR